MWSGACGTRGLCNVWIRPHGSPGRGTSAGRYGNEISDRHRFQSKREHGETRRDSSSKLNSRGARGAKLRPSLGCEVGPAKIGGCWFAVKISFNQGMDKTPTKVLGSLLALVPADKKEKQRVGAKDGSMQLLLFWILPGRPSALTSPCAFRGRRRIEPSCIIFVVIPDFELLSGTALPCGELLQFHLVDLAPDLLLHLGDFLFRVNGLSLGIVQDQLAPEQMSVFERLDAVLCLSWRLKFRKGKSTSVVCFRVSNCGEIMRQRGKGGGPLTKSC